LTGASELLTLTPAGLYCPAGDFFVDPLRGVDRAVITHGHSDHARPGHTSVLATPETLAIMAARLGPHFASRTQGEAYGRPVSLGEVSVTLHPAGHVLGSAQVLIERKGLRVVVSGDYKRARDPTCAGFEPVRCHAFVTEATFGLPVFRHPPAAAEIGKLLEHWRLFPESTHLVGAYSLGKAQRVIALLREAGYERPVHIHGAVERMNDLYRSFGVALGDTPKVAATDRAALAGDIVICPPSAIADLWARKFPSPVAAFASGWMRVRARARQKSVELPLVISDHADWNELCATIAETGCSEVWVTHGAEDALVHWARTQGLAARPLHMIGYGDESEETVEPAREDEAPST
jgi:putative mRNA 3-end processing factor